MCCQSNTIFFKWCQSSKSFLSAVDQLLLRVYFKWRVDWSHLSTTGVCAASILLVFVVVRSLRRWMRSPASARRRAWGTSSITPTACSVPGHAVLSTGACVERTATAHGVRKSCRWKSYYCHCSCYMLILLLYFEVYYTNKLLLVLLMLLLLLLLTLPCYY